MHPEIQVKSLIMLRLTCIEYIGNPHLEELRRECAGTPGHEVENWAVSSWAASDHGLLGGSSKDRADKKPCCHALVDTPIGMWYTLYIVVTIGGVWVSCG
jgi:hypothetical protein